jgi:glycosyltransferase involved in cell wall biosynthesis
VQIAVLFRRTYPELNVQFVWKGEGASLEGKMLKADAAKMSLAPGLIFEEPSDDMRDFYAQIDVLLLTSREDPYPLVVLEAANAKVPTICFAKSGGAVEFVGKNAGTVIDYLDLPQAVVAIYTYKINAKKLRTDGNAAYEQSVNRHQDGKMIAGKLLGLVKSLQ